MKIGLLTSRIRVEEKLIIAAFEQRGVDFEIRDIRKSTFDLQQPERWQSFDVILERCVSHSGALTALQILERWGIPCVNRADIAQVCGSKLETSLALLAHQVPTPETRIAYTPESALEAIREMGFPVVLKPVVGSWGRLLSKVNDVESAEAILEHKSTLGSYQHSIFYIQQYIDKPGRDLRTFVIGDQTVAGIARHSSHWITNTARNGRVEHLPISDEINDLSLRAARAVGGGVVAVDLLETRDGGLLVNEVNYTMEFRNSIERVDLPGKLVDHVLEVAEGRDVRNSNRENRTAVPRPLAPGPSV